MPEVKRCCEVPLVCFDSSLTFTGLYSLPVTVEVGGNCAHTPATASPREQTSFIHCGAKNGTQPLVKVFDVSFTIKLTAESTRDCLSPQFNLIPLLSLGVMSLTSKGAMPPRALFLPLICVKSTANRTKQYRK